MDSTRSLSRFDSYNPVLVYRHEYGTVTPPFTLVRIGDTTISLYLSSDEARNLAAFITESLAAHEARRDAEPDEK